MKKKKSKQIEKLLKERDMMERYRHSKGKFIYEFLMLFLAVTAGFFVDNIREYYIERHREKQFVESLVLDLKMDTTQISEILKSNKEQIKGIDSLLCSFEKEGNEKLVNDIYYYSRFFLSSCEEMQPNERTITQLKNSGSMRLIRNFNVSDSIMNYDQTIKNIKDYNEFLYKFFQDQLQTQTQLLDYKIYRIYRMNQIKNVHNISLLIAHDKPINVYYNQSYMFAAAIYSYNNSLASMKTDAGSLIQFLKKAYRLDD
jgi:hypothetical protein